MPTRLSIHLSLEQPKFYRGIGCKKPHLHTCFYLFYFILLLMHVFALMTHLEVLSRVFYFSFYTVFVIITAKLSTISVSSV